MNLLYSEAAKEIRALARQELRHSKKLWKEYKKSRRFRSYLSRKLLITFFLVPLLVIAGTHGSFPRLLLILAFYCTATALFRGSLLLQELYQSYDRAFFMHMPVSDDDFFNYALWRFLQSSLWTWLYSAGAYSYMIFVLDDHFSPTLRTHLWVAAFAVSVLQWLTVVSTALLLSAYRPRWLQGIAALLFYIAMWAVIFVPISLVYPMQKVLLLLPTAWMAYVFKSGIIAGDMQAWHFLIPTFLLLISTPWTIQKLRKSYPIKQLEYPWAIQRVKKEEAEDEVLPEDAETSLDSYHTETPTETSTPAGLQKASVIDAGMNWSNSGWIARIVYSILNVRQRFVAEFMLAGKTKQWTGQWRVAGLISCAGAAFTILIRTPYTQIYLWPCLISAAIGMPLLGGNWPGFQNQYCAGKVMPLHSIFPIGFTETSLTIVKVNTVRILSYFPFLMFYAAALGWRWGWGINLGLLFATELLLGILLVQPVIVLFKYSQGTNDTKVLNFHTTAYFLSAIMLGALLVGSIFGLFIAPELYKILFAFAMLIASGLLWAFYKLLYERGRIDLIRSPDSD